MLPYIIIKPVHIGPLALQPFGALVVIGVILGIGLATRRANSLGLDLRSFHAFITSVLIGGFIGAHVLDAVFYRPQELIARPWSLFFLWEGLSSFGGFVGAALGGLVWKYYGSRSWLSFGSFFTVVRPVRRAIPAPILRYADVVLSVFPVSWVFGRAGCSVVHDHPGIRVAEGTLLAVPYGPGPSRGFGLCELRYGSLPRYDLGLLELVFTAGLALAFALSWRRRDPRGWYIVAASLAYAPVRFGLDFLRAIDVDGADPRYGLLTPAQWACLALFAFGVALAGHVLTKKASSFQSTPARPRKAVGELPSRE